MLPETDTEYPKLSSSDPSEAVIFNTGIGLFVGEALGLADGLLLIGEADGDLEGLDDGELVGDSLGLFDGDLEGLDDGELVGDLLGLFDGDLEGLDDGELVGDLLGLLDGEALVLAEGLLPRPVAGETVGATLWLFADKVELVARSLQSPDLVQASPQ
jgi:hypothetical protein